MSRPALPRPVSLRLALHVLAMVAAASIATAPLTAGDGPAPSPTGNSAATRPAEAVQVEIPLRHLGRTLVVDARAGEETLELVVGTGREETVLTREAASRVAAAPAADASQGEAELAVLALGPAAFGDVRIQIAGRDELGNLPPSSDGFLGLSLFSRHRITLDLPGMRLLLGSPGDPVVGSQTAGRPVGFSLEPGFDAAAGGLPTIPVQIAGETHRARLDTGTPAGLTLPARYAATLPLLSAPGRIGLAHTSRGEFAILGSTLDGTLEIAGQRVERPRVWFSELYDTATVGLGVLEPFALVLDMPGRTVRLERPETGAHRRQQLAAIVPGVESRGPGLREAFNADAGKVRLLLILSPT